MTDPVTFPVTNSGASSSHDALDAPAAPASLPAPCWHGADCSGTGPDCGPSGMGLTPHEATCLAYRIVARWARDEQPEWEDLPALSEAAYERLLEALTGAAAYLASMADGIDRNHNIDSRFLMEKASE